MYGGGSSKLGRLGGGGGGGGPSKNRKSFPLPPPSHRPSSSGRLSSGGNAPRGRANQSNKNSLSTSASKQPIEESFSLVSGSNPFAFGMIIKLTPDLLDEIRRVEAQGETAKMKFDSNGSSCSGNVINVGTKDFKFTWSHEMGDLCDIYEERQTGEDGNGLLVESGSAWRKLSVQRILDESTTNHVKMRSEEAERKNKSRKAIVLEPGNPSMKNQIKALAAAESNPWNFKHKKDPLPKKRKIDPSQGSNPLTFSSKTISSTTPSLKARPSSSPLPSSPLLSGNPTSPFAHQNASKNQEMVEDAIHIQLSCKDHISSSEKDLASSGKSKARETIGVEGKSETISSDLQTMLVSLLVDNPKGMPLKALELAVGNMFSNPVKKIEPILKKIATFQAPGRYILRKDIDFESSKKPSSVDRSPPEDSHEAHHPEDIRDHNSVSEASVVDRAFGVENREDALLDSKVGEENNVVERNDTHNPLPDLFGEKEGSDKSEGQVASSSNSGSDNDSDSSDSGSDSSSDSESDDSSNSKEASDEDVDIMTSDDDKEQKNKHESFDEQQDQYGSMKVEVEKILPDDDQESEMVVVVDDDLTREAEKHGVEANGSSIDNELHKEHQSFIETLFDEKEDTVEDGFDHYQSKRYERISDSRSKRGFGPGTSDEKFDHGKRLKAGSLPRPSAWSNDSDHFAKSPHLASPERRDLESHKGLPGRVDRDGHAEFRIGQEHNHTIVGNSAADSRQFNQRVDDVRRGSASDVAGRQEQVIERFGCGPKYSGRNSNVQERDFVPEGKDNYEKQAEDEYNKDEKEPRCFKEGGNRNKHPVLSDSQFKKHGDIGKSKEAGLISKPHNSQKDDRRSSVNGRDKMLQRELSDLELGEFRDPAPRETSKSKKQSEKASFKKSESKPGVPDRQDMNFVNGRPIVKDTLDFGKALPSYLGGEALGYPEDSSKKRTPEHRVGEITRPQHQTPNSQPLQQSKVHHAEVDKGTPLMAMQHDPKYGQVPTAKKQKNRRRSSTPADSVNAGKEIPLPEPKRRDSDENSCLYYKYEKEAPELKGPIKDQSQYEEYLQEYAVEYDCYVSLAKTIEAECERFRKLGKDIEKVKPGGTENYNRVVGCLRDSYLQSGSSHKRLKKIFNVVHRELVNLKQRMKEFALLQGSS